MRNFCFGFMILLFSTCELSTDWELLPDEEQKLVVEAILTNENKIQEIRLSKSFPELNGTPPKMENATVTVRANGVVYKFDEDNIDNGLYKSQRTFGAVQNVDYELMIDLGGKIYRATSQLSNVVAIPDIYFDTLANSEELVLADFVPLYNPNQQAMYEIDIDWTHLNQKGEQRAKTFFYTFSSVHLSALSRPQREKLSFPKSSRIIVKKYGLNDDFAAYLRAKAIETEWNGTFFYSTAENLPTNISNDALGFYSTCSVLLDTLIAE